MKKNTLIEYGFLLVSILFFIMSSWMLFKYFTQAIDVAIETTASAIAR